MKNTTKLTLGLTGLLSLSACVFDSNDNETVNSSEAIASSAIENSSSSEPVVNDAKYFYVGSNYESGSLECLTPEGESCISVGLNIYSDSYVYSNGSDLYVLEAMGADNILKVNTSAGATVSYQEKLIDAQDTISANSKAMAFLNETEAWVAFYGTAKLVKVNLEDGSVIQTVEIPESEEGVNPSPSSLAIVDGKLYASLQRMDAFWNANTPHILVLDATTGTIQDTIITNKTNIQSLVKFGENLVTVASGNSTWNADYTEQTSANDGGLELINLADLSVTTLATEDDIGGKPSSLVTDGANKAWVSYGHYASSQVKSLDLSTSTFATADLPGIVNGSGVKFDSKTNTLFVNQRTPDESGVLLYRADTLYMGVLNTDKLAPTNGTVLRKRK